MTVFIEYVLLDNFVIDYLLLKSTFLSLGKIYHRRRLILCSLMGAIFSLVAPLLSFSNIVLIITKICMGVIIISLANKYKSNREYAIFLTTFLFFTVLFGGVVMATFSVFNLSYGTELCVSLVILPVLIGHKAIKSVFSYILKNKTSQNFIYKVEIVFCGKTLTCTGFLDSGNGAMVNGKPVIFIDFALVKKYCNVCFLKNLKKTSITTLNGTKEKYYFILESIKVFFKDKPNIYNNVTACIIKEGFSDGFDLLLSPLLVYGGVYEHIA